MKIISYMIAMSKLSTIEGRKESCTGEYNLSAKLYRRGLLNEDEFIEHTDRYKSEIKSLDHQKWVILKKYAKAA